MSVKRLTLAGAITALAISGCTYDVVFVKVVGEGCSSVTAGQAANDSGGDATGTAAGGGGSFTARLERAFASDDSCPPADEPGTPIPHGGDP